MAIRLFFENFLFYVLSSCGTSFAYLELLYLVSVLE